MPQLITHNLFSKDVFNTLDDDIKNSIKNNINVYEMFSQSFDNLLYYSSFNLKNTKRINNLSKRGHKTNVKNYFLNIINNINKLHLENDEQALSYLFGSINHYVLDSTCHPFIFYKTGVYNKKDKDTKKYLGLHGDMESNIDAFFYINRFHKSYHKVNVTKEFIPKIKFSNNLKLIVDKTFLDTFNEEDIAKCYFKSYKNSRILYTLFINDKYGIKKWIYKIYDKIFINRKNNYEYYTTYIKQPNIKYLNIEHKKWYYPSDPNISSNESFIDLYNKSIKKSSELITLAYKVINKKMDIKEFENKIDNLSYVRGLDCDNSRCMTKFEF
jgi:hypothetical protein